MDLNQLLEEVKLLPEEDLEILAEKVSEIRDSRQKSQISRLRSDLDEVAEECSARNWDGIGAEPVSEDAVSYGRKFIDLLSSRSIDFADANVGVSATPTGEVFFDWPKRNSIFMVQIFSDGTVVYSSVGGSRKFKAKLKFDEIVSSSLFEDLITFLRS
ncbi:MAG: hypothetical protein NUW37_10950 [Planctomycetes bacterium]|nr:hypothetical protein [Planctomycetota bacterium]